MSAGLTHELGACTMLSPLVSPISGLADLSMSPTPCPHGVWDYQGKLS